MHLELAERDDPVLRALDALAPTDRELHPPLNNPHVLLVVFVPVCAGGPGRALWDGDARAHGAVSSRREGEGHEPGGEEEREGFEVSGWCGLGGHCG
jgi:hypothetical protein